MSRGDETREGWTRLLLLQNGYRRMLREGKELLAENVLVQEVVLHFQRILNSSIVIGGRQCWADTVCFFFLFPF